MPPMKQCNSKGLIDQIITRNRGVPNYALLLGAGASVTSGVKTAEEMVWEWRHELYQSAPTSLPYQEWLEEQPWYGQADEYGILFEKTSMTCRRCDERP